MIYKIDDKYYIRVGRKYFKIDLVANNGDLSIKPTMEFREDSPNLKIESQPFDEDFKKNYLQNIKSNENEMTRTNNKYR